MQRPRRAHLRLRLLGGILHDEHDIVVARETFRRCWYQWHRLHGFVQRHTVLRERDDVVKARRRFEVGVPGGVVFQICTLPLYMPC